MRLKYTGISMLSLLLLLLLQDDATEELGMDDFQFATKEYIPNLTSQPW